MNPARVAPIPNETSKLGKAQQSIVPKDVKSDKYEVNRLLPLDIIQ